MKLRLLKLEVRPVYVLDDGTSLTERAGGVFTLNEADIPVFPAMWADRFAQLREQVEAQDVQETDARTEQDEP